MSIIKKINYRLCSLKINPWYVISIVFLSIFLGELRFYLISLDALKQNGTIDFLLVFFQACSEVLLALFIGLLVIIVDSLISESIKNRPYFKKYLEHTNSTLRLFGFTLNDFHDDKKKDDAEKYYLDEIDKKFKKPGEKEFQFLLLDPFSEAFIRRSEFEGKDHNILRLECAKSISNIKKLKKTFIEQNLINKNQNRIFDFRFYNYFPTHSLIITDDIAWVGPFLFQKIGTKSKWFQIKNYSALNEYIQEFNKYWDESSYDEVTLLRDSSLERRRAYNNLILIQKNMPEIVDDILEIQKSNQKFKIPNGSFEDLLKIAEFMESERLKNYNVDTKKPNKRNLGDCYTISYQHNNDQITIQLPILLN